MTEPLLDDQPRRIVIPYTPREHFRALHNSLKRFIFVVAHRRAGKTVTLCNKIIRAGMTNEREYPPPRYAYIGPTFAQTKDLVWGYFKHYTSPIPGIKIIESELQMIMPNGTMINLYGGAQAYERMRGLYFDGAVLDEFPLINPSAWTTVVRPCLADYRGWVVISGTSNGDDHFGELKKKAERDGDWDVFSIPVTDTDALHPDEVADMKKDMSPEEYAREMLCSFDAPVEGAYYAYILNDLQTQKKITGVAHDNAAKVITWWDLGIDDATAIWFVQLAGREVHLIDYVEVTGKGIPDLCRIIKEKPYLYSAHIMPADVKARELGTGQSRYEIFISMLDNVLVCPPHRIEDGISAVRHVLPQCWIDSAKCEQGISAIRAYRCGKTGQPVHDWASHGADALRYGSVSMNIARTFTSNRNVIGFYRPLRRRIAGLCH